MNTASRRNKTRSGSVNSACDQSTEARSVCWRRTAVRAPPVNSRNRSCRLSTISASDNARTRAAASSIASGMPSRRRQISRHRRGIVVGDGEIGPSTAGTVGEQLDGFVGQRQRRHPPAHLAGHPDRLTAGRQQRQPRQRRPQSNDQRRARVQQMLTVVQHHQHLSVADETAAGCPSWSGPADRAGPARGPPRPAPRRDR